MRVGGGVDIEVDIACAHACIRSGPESRGAKRRTCSGCYVLRKRVELACQLAQARQQALVAV
jgi:hypothetical protein